MNASEISLTEFKYEMVYEQRFEHLVKAAPNKGRNANSSINNIDGVAESNIINNNTMVDDEEMHPGELVVDAAGDSKEEIEQPYEEEEDYEK